MKLNASEWPYIAIGCFAACGSGSVAPLFAFVYSDVMKVCTLLSMCSYKPGGTTDRVIADSRYNGARYKEVALYINELN